MIVLPSRRSLILTSIAASFATLRTSVLPASARVAPASAPLHEALAMLETSSGGRIGLSAKDISDGRQIGYRSEERFPMSSTFKVIAVAAVMKRSTTDDGLLQRRISFSRSDIVTYSPITKRHLSRGMTVQELCAAAIQYSDNTAANLLMKLLGGPQAVTDFARSIGDVTFQLDRWEPELNSAVPGDSRDTTTPEAMMQSLARIVASDLLSDFHRELLLMWMRESTTGAARIRAGVPESWQVADKTGSGMYGTSNDIALLSRPDGGAIVVAIYFTQKRKLAPLRNDLIATAARAMAGEFMRES